MIEGRFSDKGFLSSYDLDIDLFKIYNLNVIDVVPLRKSYIIATDRGNKILKRVDYSLDRLKFINNSVEYLIAQGFDRLVKYDKNIDGHLFTWWKNNVYILRDYLEGEECDYSNELDVSITINTIAEMHRASKGLPYEYNGKFSSLNKFIIGEKDDVKKLKEYRDSINIYRNKTEFHKLFTSYVDQAIDSLNQGIRLIEEADYQNICHKEEYIAFCYEDLAYQNIVIKNEKGYITDLDEALIDFRVQDLCNLIRRMNREEIKGEDLTKKVIDIYSETNRLNEEELQLLKGMLLIPKNFINISKDYFERRRNFSEETVALELKKITDCMEIANVSSKK